MEPHHIPRPYKRFHTEEKLKTINKNEQ